MKAIIMLIVSNWDVLIGAVLVIIGGFSVIAKITPTPKDDAALAKVYKIINAIALNTTKPKA